jgi:predicted component of type VI protein secretion system
MIIEVDGNTEKQDVSKFVDNEFFAVDSLAFREYVADSTPDIDLEISVDIDGEEVEVTVPMTVQFFWPSSRV